MENSIEKKFIELEQLILRTRGEHDSLIDKINYFRIKHNDYSRMCKVLLRIVNNRKNVYNKIKKTKVKYNKNYYDNILKNNQDYKNRARDTYNAWRQTEKGKKLLAEAAIRYKNKLNQCGVKRLRDLKKINSVENV